MISPEAYATPAPRGIRLRPLAFSDLLDEAFKIYRRHFLLFFGIALALELPTMVIDLVSGAFRAGGVYNAVILSAISQAFSFQPVSPSSDLSELASFSLLWLIPVVGFDVLLIPFKGVSLIGTPGAALTRLTTELALGAPATWRSVARMVLRRYWILMGLNLLILLALGPLFIVGFLLEVVGIALPLWIAIRWLVVVPVVVSEGTGVRDALSRSWHLVRGRWWECFGIVIVATLLTLVLPYVVSIVGTVLLLVLPPSDVKIAAIYLMRHLADVAIAPAMPIVISLVYLDLRVRREALDLQMLAREV